MAGQSETTTDHYLIQKWYKERNGGSVISSTSYEKGFCEKTKENLYILPGGYPYIVLRETPSRQ